MTDFEKIAIERLASLGTDRGAALAMEIQRGRARRAERHELLGQIAQASNPDGPAPTTLRELYELRIAAERDRRARDLAEARCREDYEAGARARMIEGLRPATAQDYTRWLRLFIGNGGIPHHFFDYPLSGDWYVADNPDRPLVVEPLYGSDAVHLIIAEGVTVAGGRGHGHNELFYPDGTSNALVSVFSNTLDVDLPQAQ